MVLSSLAQMLRDLPARLPHRQGPAREGLRATFLLRLLSPILLFGTVAAADPLPIAADPFVTDGAATLAPADVARLRSDLAALRNETGVEMTVLTIRSRADYDATPSIEAFAAAVFAAWGVGDPARNDGILVLVAAEDREMRLHLGAAYDQDYDVLAQDIIDRFFLPDFRDGEIERGIITGTEETIARIARRHVEGLPAETLSKRRGGLPSWLPFLIVAGLGAALAFRQRIGDWAHAVRRCPNCGHRGLRRERAVEAPDRGVIRTACRHCSYRDDRVYRITPTSRPKNKPGFGGGKSSGGGATGRW